MATSELGYYARFSESLIDAEDFVDTGMARRALNNLDHLADQRGQVLVNWCPTGTAAGDYLTVYESSPAAETYYEIWRSSSFDLSVKPDGSSYSVRLRSYFTSNSGTYGVTLKYALVAADLDADRAAAERERGDANVGSNSRTSATYAWATPSSLLYMDADRVARARGTVSTINAVGGPAFPATVVRARIVVWANAASGATARLAGFYAAEYLAP